MARVLAELPANAVKYIRRVEELTGIPVALLSTSPERDDTTWCATRSRGRSGSPPNQEGHISA